MSFPEIGLSHQPEKNIWICFPGFANKGFEKINDYQTFPENLILTNPSILV